MNSMWMRNLCALGVAGAMAYAAGLDSPAKPPASGQAPVLQGSEPTDTGVFTLPGGPTRPARVLKPFSEAPAAPIAKVAPKLPDLPETVLPPASMESPLPPKRALKPLGPLPAPSPVVPPLPDLLPSSVPKVPAPMTKSPAEESSELRKIAKVWFPPDFEKDSAGYCQQRIGEWSQPDAYNLMGPALRQRPAAGDDGEVAGKIYAFADPTGRYREIELDFAGDTHLLRTVFVYPKTMTWVEARRLWGADVSATDANKGRIFYSYTNRRLDVLVGSDGKVISLGLY